MLKICKKLLSLVLLTPTLTLAQSMGGYPAEEYCSDTCFNRGVASGFNDGISAGISQCVADPSSCGISLAACMDDLDIVNDFGETEPNDNLISADPLQPNTNYWGQIYGPPDQDWFYTVTTVPNQNILINFSALAYSASTIAPPDAEGDDAETITFDLSGWTISIRDSAGNVIAAFDTGRPGLAVDVEFDSDTARLESEEGDLAIGTGTVTYRATLGFAGTYYVEVKPNSSNRVYDYYNLSVVLQETDQDSPNYIVGFYDIETEPNNLPSEADPLATSVTMYGLVNLMFNVPLEPTGDDEDATAVWGQGEDDWFVYYSSGNESISLSFCAREECGDGNWSFELFDETTARRLQAGARRDEVIALLSFNTSNQAGEDPESFRFGLSEPGYYYAKVDHKRLFSAPCRAWFYNGDDRLGRCSCTGEQASEVSESGNSCWVPVDCEASGTPSCNEVVPVGAECVPGLNIGCYDFPEGCYADSTAPTPDTGGDTGDDTDTDTDTDTGYRPGYPITDEDGDGDVDEDDMEIVVEEGATCLTYQTLAPCLCDIYGGVVEMPEEAYTSPYNFTWQATKLPPSTIDTDAYQDFIGRPSPY